jgi:hypothetical protein
VSLISKWKKKIKKFFDKESTKQLEREFRDLIKEAGIIDALKSQKALQFLIDMLVGKGIISPTASASITTLLPVIIEILNQPAAAGPLTIAILKSRVNDADTHDRCIKALANIGIKGAIADGIVAATTLEVLRLLDILG